MKYFFFPIVFLAFNLLAIPSVIFLGLIDRVFSLEKPFDDDFRKRVKEKYEKVFNVEYVASEDNAYWFMLILLYENHMNSIMVKQILYFTQRLRFARNLAGAFFLTTIVGMLSMLACFNLAESTSFNPPIGTLNVFLILCFFLFFGYYTRYKYFTSKKITKLLIRSFMLLDVPDKK